MEGVFLLYRSCGVLEKIWFWSVVIIINLFFTCDTGMYNLNIISVVTYYYYYYNYCDLYTVT